MSAAQHRATQRLARASQFSLRRFSFAFGLVDHTHGSVEGGSRQPCRQYGQSVVAGNQGGAVAGQKRRAMPARLLVVGRLAGAADSHACRVALGGDLVNDAGRPGDLELQSVSHRSPRVRRSIKARQRDPGHAASIRRAS